MWYWTSSRAFQITDDDDVEGSSATEVGIQGCPDGFLKRSTSKGSRR